MLSAALLSGVLVNYLVETFGFVVMPLLGEQHSLLPDVAVYSSGIILAILMAKVFLSMLPIKLSAKSCCS